MSEYIHVRLPGFRSSHSGWFFLLLKNRRKDPVKEWHGDTCWEHEAGGSWFRGSLNFMWILVSENSRRWKGLRKDGGTSKCREGKSEVEQREGQ